VDGLNVAFASTVYRDIGTESNNAPEEELVILQTFHSLIVLIDESAFVLAWIYFNCSELYMIMSVYLTTFFHLLILLAVSAYN
jgi:hypothetical protein